MVTGWSCGFAWRLDLPLWANERHRCPQLKKYHVASMVLNTKTFESSIHDSHFILESLEMLSNWVLFIPIMAIANARQISFPPISGFSSDQAVMGIIEADITQAKFGGLTTYANLPYVHCLAPKGEDVEKFDIAILGAPFDTVRSPGQSNPNILSLSRATQGACTTVARKCVPRAREEQLTVSRE